MSGLRFRKLDLHVHTPASTDFKRPSGGKSDVEIATAIVQEALKQGVEGIAITDHNSAEWVEKIKHAATGTSLVVFPGVEITAQGGIHIIALFDPTKGATHIRDLLSKLGLKPEEHGLDTTVVPTSVPETIDTIALCDALSIAAHINSDHGIFRDMEGQSRIQAVKHPKLRAAEATDCEDVERGAAHKRAQDFLDGKDANYKRKLAVYQASDNPSTDGSGGHTINGIGTRCSYFKMEKIDLRSLRNCFDDFEVRIRNVLPQSDMSYPRIKQVKVTSGFLDGAEVVFHEGLNSIIGAKGSGKSLLIELLRFVLNQPSSNPAILDDYKSKLKARLGMYGKVQAVLTLDTGKEITVERCLDAEHGDPYSSGDAIDIRRNFPVLFLSQGEIIRIAENEKEQLAFIDLFFDFRSYKESVSQIESDLHDLDKEYADVLNARRETEELTQKTQNLVNEIKSIDEALADPVFNQFAAAQEKQKAIQSLRTHIVDLNHRVAKAQEMVLGMASPAIAETVRDDPAVKRAEKSVKDAGGHIRQGFQQISEKLTEYERSVDTEEKSSLSGFNNLKTQYEESVRTRGGSYQTLAEKRGRLMKELGETQNWLTKVQTKSQRLKTLHTDRTNKLDTLANIYKEYSAERKAKCEMFFTQSNERLKIDIQEASNSAAFRENLIQMSRGSGIRSADIEKVCASTDPKDIIDIVTRYSIRRNQKVLDPIVTASGIQMERIVSLAEFLLGNNPLDVLLGMQYKLYPEDRPTISYRVDNGDYAQLATLSIGQKCTAMLVMALSEGSMPIIIDQPEDSLDIRSVWSDVCEKLRIGKETRQFIFTTHSACLAVASDSDYFVVLEATSDHATVEHSGAMDHDPMNDAVLGYLEGGLETYRTKHLKYDADRKLIATNSD